jgi:glycosyltransferase involved in cell wall biosynthesis
MLPLGVIIPTKNSMAYLPRHVAGLRPWLDLAREVVVVDSYSNDGTLDYLRANLKHPAVRFTNHPPGLYASWNHGIGQITSQYVFIATTGDTITREGICRLVETAESLTCDVVISNPIFCDASGNTLPDRQWPVHDVIATLGVKQPRRLQPFEAVIFAALHPTDALTGSCASDLFRTEILERHPFPTDFGISGDTMWGLMHAAEVVWGVVPESFSTFLLHPTNASPTERATYAAARRADAVLCAAAKRWQLDGVVSGDDLTLIRWTELLDTLGGFLDSKASFDRLRRGRVPWALNPAAWAERRRRNQSFTRLQDLKREALAGLVARHPG